MNNSQSRALVLAIAVSNLCVAAPRAYALFPISFFDSDAQGWTTAGASADFASPIGTGGPISWDTRGNPGGALSVGDYYYDTWISAPASYLGNQGDMFSLKWTYDILIRYTDQTSVPYPSVAMTNGTLKLLYTIHAPPVNAWERRVVIMDPLNWTIDTGNGNQGNAPTQAQMYSVLNNLTGLYILTEWRTGPDDTSIDNVGISSQIPMPAPGDYNHDGITGAGDYVLWRKQLNTVYVQNDYTIWRQHFGGTASAASGASLAPEPGGLAAVATAVLCLGAGRRFRLG
jgi:hypothetical protein